MFKHFTAAALALLALAPASAATLTLEEWNSYITYGPNPAVINTTVGPDFTIGARNTTKNRVQIADKALTPTLTLPDGTDVSGLFSARMLMGMDQGEVLAQFGVKYEEAGEYTLTVPEGALKVGSRKEDEPYGTNPEFTVVYNILGKQEPLTNYLEKYELTPASGSTIHSIHRNLMITFPDVDATMDFGRVYVGGVSLTCPDGEKVNLYDFEVPREPNGERSINATVFYFKQVYSTPGEYTLNIESGVFRITVPDVTSPTGYTALYSPAITAKYTVSDEIAADELTLDVYKTIPEAGDNDKVPSLHHITVIFPQCGAPEKGLAYGNSTPDDPSCGAPAKRVAASDIDLNQITLRNKYSYSTYYCKRMVIADTRDMVDLYFDNIDTNGIYTLTIGEGLLEIRDTYPVIYNLPIEIEFNLSYDPDSVDEVEAAAEVVAPVYDLMGRKVLDNASKADIERLPAGFYIHNGEKHAVR